MSELTARLAIYGSIDRAVLDGSLSPDDAAVHLPPYGAGSVDGASAAGWYDALSELLAGSTDGPTSVPLPPPDPAPAIDELAERSLEHPIDAEHRLRALFLADRLLEDLDTSPGSSFVTAIQAVVVFGADQEDVADPEGAALRLIEMIDDHDRFPGGAGYAALAAEAHEAGLVSSTTAALAAVACDEATARFEVPGTGALGVAAVVTSRVVVAADDGPVSDLRLRFHPGRWPACMPTFWAAMDPLAPPPPDAPSPTVDPGTSLFVYREHVGDQSSASQWFNPVLEFWYDELTVGPPTDRVVDGFAIHYGMARTLPAGETQDTRILVDDGELTVRRSNVANGSMTVTATTYKKLAMQGPLPSAGLAIFACVSGWADHAKALVTGCLINP